MSAGVVSAVQEYAADLRTDARTQVKFALTFVLGLSAFIVTCVELHRATSGTYGYVLVWDADKERDFSEKAAFPAATICPDLLVCPPWCSGPATSNCTCVHTPDSTGGANALFWRFNPAVECFKVVKSQPGGDPPKTESLSAAHNWGDTPVPVALEDGFLAPVTGCVTVNWDQEAGITGPNQFVGCKVKLSPTSLDPDPKHFLSVLGANGKGTYPFSILDLNMRIQFHGNPKVWPNPHATEEIDKTTGVHLHYDAWKPFDAFADISEKVVVTHYDFHDAHSFWEIEGETVSYHSLFWKDHLARTEGKLVWPSAFNVDEHPLLIFTYGYPHGDRFKTVEKLEVGRYPARWALGVSGGIAFLLGVLNVALFWCCVNALGLGGGYSGGPGGRRGGAQADLMYGQTPYSAAAPAAVGVGAGMGGAPPPNQPAAAAATGGGGGDVSTWAAPKLSGPQGGGYGSIA